MKHERNKHIGSSKAPKVKSTKKRMKQIQRVFDDLGIGDEESRRTARLPYTPMPEQTTHYRIILSGSTLG